MTDALIGEIRLFGGSYTPIYWLPCDGETYAITQYQALYSVIGTAYGGDNRTSFSVPDFRGRIPLHMGKGPGLTGRRLGEMGGHEEVTLTEANLPPHTHTLNGSSGGDRSVDPRGHNLTVLPLGQRFYKEADSDLVALSADAVFPGGEATGHSNLMSSSVISFIICHHGFFPSRI